MTASQKQSKIIKALIIGQDFNSMVKNKVVQTNPWFVAVYVCVCVCALIVFSALTHSRWLNYTGLSL